jgi:hypothetical protein
MQACIPRSKLRTPGVEAPPPFHIMDYPARSCRKLKVRVQDLRGDTAARTCDGMLKVVDSDLAGRAYRSGDVCIFGRDGPSSWCTVLGKLGAVVPPRFGGQ